MTLLSYLKFTRFRTQWSTCISLRRHWWPMVCRVIHSTRSRLLSQRVRLHQPCLMSRSGAPIIVVSIIISLGVRRLRWVSLLVLVWAHCQNMSKIELIANEPRAPIVFSHCVELWMLNEKLLSVILRRPVLVVGCHVTLSLERLITWVSWSSVVSICRCFRQWSMRFVILVLPYRGKTV